MKKAQHYSELTVLSAIAILLVIGIHGCSSALSKFNAGTMNYADAAFALRILSNISAPAVPIFLFVSGYKYVLNNIDTPYFVFLIKRLPRVVMSFAIINTLFWLLDSVKYMEIFDVILLAKTYLHSWVGYSVAYQLWYIPMYCCVIVVYPLVRRIIPSTIIRFSVYAFVGITQRILEVPIPVLATYPIRFISYPVFFEMGVLVAEKKWPGRVNMSRGVLLSGAYVALVSLFSWTAPTLSSHSVI